MECSRHYLNIGPMVLLDVTDIGYLWGGTELANTALKIRKHAQEFFGVSPFRSLPGNDAIGSFQQTHFNDMMVGLNHHCLRDSKYMVQATFTTDISPVVVLKIVERSELYLDAAAVRGYAFVGQR